MHAGLAPGFHSSYPFLDIMNHACPPGARAQARHEAKGNTPRRSAPETPRRPPCLPPPASNSRQALCKSPPPAAVGSSNLSLVPFRRPNGRSYKSWPPCFPGARARRSPPAIGGPARRGAVGAVRGHIAGAQSSGRPPSEKAVAWRGLRPQTDKLWILAASLVFLASLRLSGNSAGCFSSAVRGRFDCLESTSDWATVR